MEGGGQGDAASTTPVIPTPYNLRLGKYGQGEKQGSSLDLYVGLLTFIKTNRVLLFPVTHCKL